jgi:hypothetical protein
MSARRLAFLAGLLLAVACSEDETSRADDDDGSGAGTPTGTSSGPSTSSGGPNAGNEMLDAHNAVRQNASPTPSPTLEDMVWDDALEASAQAWADRCVFEHGGGMGAGENLYANTAMVPASNVVNSWAGEAQYYDHGSNSCSDVCGHYTQIVWRDSTRVGCGVADCPNLDALGGPAQFWVCHYQSPGNFSGESPY